MAGSDTLGAATIGRRVSLAAILVTATLVALLSVATAARADGVPLGTGEVLAATGSGVVKHFDRAGNLLDSLNTTTATNNTAGMCFDSARNLFVTDFAANTLSKFDAGGNLLGANFASGFNANPESCTVDAANNVYVGQADGSRQILKFDPSGKLLASFSPATDARGTDWVDLSSDQCTLLYTGEGSLIKRFNVCTNTQLSDFASGLPGPCFELRIRPNGEVLVGCAGEAVRLDPSGAVLQTYPIAGARELFGLNLDPNGTSFWTGDIFTGIVYQVDIASGNVLTQFNSSPATQLAGLAIVGEIVVSQPKLTLGPATQSQTVGSSALVTATLAAGATPTPGKPILFSVSGVNTGSGAGTTDANGQAPFSYTGAKPGTDTVTACYDANGNGTCDPGELTATATVTWTAAAPPPPPPPGSDPSIAASAAGFSATEGSQFSGLVAKFTDPDPTATPGEYSARVKWGDGTTSQATIGGGGGSFTVTGTHTYGEEGSNAVSVTITDPGASSTPAVASTSVTVADAALKVKGVPTSHRARVNGTVATFTDQDPGGVLSDYTASIRWGDGTTTAGAISAAANGKFQVKGSHHYAKPRTFHVRVTIRDGGGSTGRATSLVRLSSAASAELRGIPAACVLGPFSVAVSGKQIARVTFRLDGQTIVAKTVRAGSRYTARLVLTSGSHRLSVRVSFRAASHARARTLHRTVAECPVGHPKFTG